VGIVCYDAEAGVCGVFFHDSTKSHLGCGSHGIGFVEDDEFECCKGGFGVRGLWEGGEDLFGAAEGFDLFSG